MWLGERVTDLCNPQSYDCLLFLIWEGQRAWLPILHDCLRTQSTFPHKFPLFSWPPVTPWYQLNSVYTICTTMFIVETGTCPNSHKEEQKVQNFCESPCRRHNTYWYKLDPNLLSYLLVTYVLTLMISGDPQMCRCGLQSREEATRTM
jgi:hypothetical protein